MSSKAFGRVTLLNDIQDQLFVFVLLVQTTDNLFNDSSQLQNQPYLAAIFKESKLALEAVVSIIMDPVDIHDEALYLMRQAKTTECPFLDIVLNQPL